MKIFTMSKGEIKRQNLFNKYSHQLHSLVGNGLLDLELKYEKTFICPVRLDQFSEGDLDTSKENFLTLEDAPPKSLGGQANTLSCKRCNNDFGHQIDYHLVERLNELDLHNFLPNTGSKVYVTHKGTKVQGTVNVNENGLITINLLNKTNNPKDLEQYTTNTSTGDVTSLQFPASRVDFRRFEIALLKTAYFLAFEKYGYCLILSEAFDMVREQLKNPDAEIYPSGFWTRQSIFNTSNEGVHFISEPGFEGFLAIFMLKTKASKSGWGVYLPASRHTYKNVIEKFKQQKPGFRLKLEAMSDDYFQSTESQKIWIEFMSRRNK